MLQKEKFTTSTNPMKTTKPIQNARWQHIAKLMSKSRNWPLALTFFTNYCP